MVPRGIRRILAIATAIMCTAVPTGALAQTVPAQTADESGQSATFGTTTIDGHQWQRLAFRPEFSFGKAAIALDLELFLNQQGGISSKGWQFGNTTQILNTIYRKIYYIRYGHPGDPIFVKVGALDDVTLGYGLIMSHYRNTLDYPGVKNLGMRFELNPILGFNVQGVINNFQDISNGGPLVGLRIAKPFLGRFEAGATIVYDFDQYAGLVDANNDGIPDALQNSPIYLSPQARHQIDSIMVAQGQTPFNWDTVATRFLNPFNLKKVGRDPFGMGGFDVGFKIIDSAPLKLTTYGQIAFSIDNKDGNQARGWGIAAPGVQLLAGPFAGRLEYRYARNEFEAQYFDELYDHARAVVIPDSNTVRTKDSSLDSLAGQRSSGIYGDATMHLGTFAQLSAQYQFLGGSKRQQRLYASAGLEKTALAMVPKLSRLDAFYMKQNIGLYGDSFFQRTIDTMYGYEVGFALGGGVEVIWSTRWLFQPIGSDPKNVTPSKQVNIETVVRF